MVIGHSTAVFTLLCLCTVAGGQNTPSPSHNSPLSGSYLGQEPPGDTPILFAPGIVSTGREHSAAMITPNGTEIWFGRLYPTAIYCMRRVNGQWTEPELATFCDTSTTSLYPVLSPDGNAIFFSSDRPVTQGQRRLPRGNYHIYVTERKADGWSEARHLDDRINFGQRQSCGSITSDSNIYFAAFTDGRSMDLFRARLNDGANVNPQNLEKFNSSSPDHSPFVAPDCTYLVFSSFRGGQGRSDLFISFRLSDNTWSEPRNMGPGINSAYKDEYPFVTPDGKYLFFNSNRPSSLNKKPIEDGAGNIYWISTAIIKEMRQDILHGK